MSCLNLPRTFSPLVQKLVVPTGTKQQQVAVSLHAVSARRWRVSWALRGAQTHPASQFQTLTCEPDQRQPMDLCARPTLAHADCWEEAVMPNQVSLWKVTTFTVLSRKTSFLNALLE